MLFPQRFRRNILPRTKRVVDSRYSRLQIRQQRAIQGMPLGRMFRYPWAITRYKRALTNRHRFFPRKSARSRRFRSILTPRGLLFAAAGSSLRRKFTRVSRRKSLLARLQRLGGLHRLCRFQQKLFTKKYTKRVALRRLRTQTHGVV